jgi:hypothetical protein
MAGFEVSIEAQSFIWIGAGRGAMEIIAPSDHARMRVSLMRVVRELAMLQSLHRGDLFIHAAAAVDRGRAVIIAGQKYSGKTTMLLALLRRAQARFVSNDRVMVDLAGEVPLVRGVPTIVKVREDSLRLLPSLTGPAFDHPHRHYLTMRECTSGSALIEPAAHQPPSMSPAQFCRWLGVEPLAAAPIGALVFPRVDPTVKRFILRDLGASETADRIRASLFSAGPGGLVSEAFGPLWDSDFPGQGDTLAACGRLAEAGIACECRIGPLAFDAPGVWDAVAAWVAERGST